jgi:cytoskeletal protein CcmA (bactofilin family)
MDDTFRGDIKINGTGSASGGTYNSVIINGSGRVNGDLQCNVFQLNGSGSVEGSLDTHDGRISGSGTIEGDLKAEQFKITGSGRVSGSVTGNDLTVSGSGTVGKNVEVQNLKIEGHAKIGFDCNAEVFTSNGAFEIGGLLNSGEITIQLLGLKSKAREIGGEKISVTVGPAHGLGVIKTIISMGILNPILEVDSIEGDEILLESTSARIVRGNNITIGPGCDIGTVEYKGGYIKNPEAKVGTETKV